MHIFALFVCEYKRWEDLLLSQWISCALHLKGPRLNPSHPVKQISGGWDGRTIQDFAGRIGLGWDVGWCALNCENWAWDLGDPWPDREISTAWAEMVQWSDSVCSNFYTYIVHLFWFIFYSVPSCENGVQNATFTIKMIPPQTIRIAKNTPNKPICYILGGH